MTLGICKKMGVCITTVGLRMGVGGGCWPGMPQKLQYVEKMQYVQGLPVGEYSPRSS